MKQVQWFPGHMFKSLREIREKIKLMDIIYLLIDARIPFSSMNPEILKIIENKPTLLLFNKIDLADRRKLDFWIDYYQKKGYHSLLINSSSGFSVNKIYSQSRIILKDKLEREAAKGIRHKVIRGMIIGIPNVGKSTLINKMVDKKAAATGNKAGVTKAQQWIKINPNFELLDTPGVLWPKFEDPRVGYVLAITGGIKDEVLPLDEVCNYLVEYLKDKYPRRLTERYKIANPKELGYVEILDSIAARRGALIKGGEVDYDRVYRILLDDVRNKELGTLLFDDEESIT